MPFAMPGQRTFFIEGTQGTNRGLDPTILKLPSPLPLICEKRKQDGQKTNEDSDRDFSDL